MKKYIILAILAMATMVYANGTMERDNNGVAVQTFAPDGNTFTLLTVNSATTDLTNRFMYSIIGTAATCKFRLMPTSAKGSYVQAAVPAASWLTFAVNRNTPFLNLSGCTGGYRILQ